MRKHIYEVRGNYERRKTERVRKADENFTYDQGTKRFLSGYGPTDDDGSAGLSKHICIDRYVAE